MTRKDYVAIAAALRSTRDRIDAHDITGDTALVVQRDVFKATVSAVATALENDNPRFDRRKFLAAAGFYGMAF